MDRHHKDKEGFKLVIGHFAGIPALSPSAKAAAPKELREKAIREFQSTLRSLVDRWIESGMQGDGDQPWARSVRYGAPESIEIALFCFWERHPPRVSFIGETQAIFTQSQIRHSGWVHLADRPESDSLEQARDYAIGFFAPLIDSPSRYRIFKCAECHAYFVKERMPKKGIVIKGGNYCEREKCKRASTIRRVYDGRDKRLSNMVRWAADAALTWKPDKRFGPMANWIVKQVRKRQPAGEEPIEVNWYSHNKQKIEAEVERRKHATR